MKKSNPIAYILCYTIRYKSILTGIERFNDYYIVFSDYNRLKELPVQQAKNKLKEIIKEYNRKSNKSESIFCWNICKIVKTSEWYKTGK